MRGGRLLLILGVIVLIGAIAVAVLLLTGDQEPSPGPTDGEDVTPTPMNTREIVIAVQKLPRGLRITEDLEALQIQPWPVDALPAGTFSQPEQVYGSIVRTEIPRGMPVLETMVTQDVDEVGETGSDAALTIPENRVAYALPVARYSSVAWGVKPGDHVDVLLSFLMVDLDQEYQSPLPNNAECLSFPDEGEGEEEGAQQECTISLMGRLETLPNDWVVNVIPRQEQRPRLVSQVTVQDAVVLQLGDWPEAEVDKEQPAPQPTPTSPAQGDPDTQTPPTPTPTPPAVKPLTLAVTRQDAIVLDYALAVGARMNLVLRPVGDTAIDTTESVTLQYLVDRFNIELPPKLPYGVTPPVSELQQIPEDENAGSYAVPSEFGGGEQQQQTPTE